MEKLIVNLSGGIRREKLDGRDYLVAPLTMIIPGVLNGSQGPILYLLEDMKATADAWNGMPIVVNHPSDDEGKALSARNPKVFNKFGIGHVYEARVEDKLSAEGWFDIAKTRKVDARIVAALLNNQKLELSTGLNLDSEPSQGVWNDANGRKTTYTSIARRYRPDHLAILPDQPGACSLLDGCGVNNIDADAGKSSISEPPPIKEETHNMAFKYEKPEVRQAAIATIVANCACWKDDQKGLEALDDRTVNALHEGVQNGTKLKETETKLTDTEKKLKEKETPAPVGNAAQTPPVDDKTKTPDPKETTNNAAPREIKLADLPADMQEDLVFARNAKQERKNLLIDRLVGNLPEASRKDEALALNKKSLADLEDMVKYLPTNDQVSNDRGSEYTGIYAGAGAGQVIGNRGSKDDNKPSGGSLSAEAPVWNFEREAAVN
jgi:hypothetical protein